MRLYLDDNIASPLLARLLRNAGHDVQLPVDVGMMGQDDSVHLTHAIAQDRVCLSQDYSDYRKLHNLVMEAKGHHSGILVVRKDNDPNRDLKPRGIVRAIGKLMAANQPVVDSYHILNQWR
jgi:predicted nuclease of predicted toxin-antitoxin system